jgi:SCY1-like protein 1
LLKYLAKTANDEQPGIRTNTTICLGKIAKHLGSSSRAKVLIAAFTRSLRDPFVHARNAALMALAVTVEYFSEEDCAFRILPAISPSLIDKEKLIRDQASKTLDIYLQKIRKHAANMPDTALPPETVAAGGGGPRMSTPQPTESTAASWAGWAISSFTNKLSAAAGEIQSSATASSAGTTGATANGSLLSPSTRPTIFSTSSSPGPQRQGFKSPPPSSGRPTSASANRDASFVPGNGEDNDGDDGDDGDDAADAWGDMDDIDEGQDPQPEDFFSSSAAEDSKSQQQKKPASAATVVTPFNDDGSEPDFAGWLAAQAEKKKATNKNKILGGGSGGGGGGLPKGLAKSGPSGSGSAPSAMKKAAPASASSSKATKGSATTAAGAAVKKTIDMKPKNTDDDDGWGGW